MSTTVEKAISGSDVAATSVNSEVVATSATDAAVTNDNDENNETKVEVLEQAVVSTNPADDEGIETTITDDDKNKTATNDDEEGTAIVKGKDKAVRAVKTAYRSRTSMEGMIDTANRVLDVAIKAQTKEIAATTSSSSSSSSIPLSNIPSKYFEQCVGIIILSAIEVGFCFTGNFGSGILLKRLTKKDVAATGNDVGAPAPDTDTDTDLATTYGWSLPSACGVTGVGYGFVIGGSIKDVIIFIMDEVTLESISSANHGMKLGGQLELTFGPYGRSAKYDINCSKSGIGGTTSFAYTKGLFAGIALEGSIVGTRLECNEKFYGTNTKHLTADEIFIYGKLPTATMTTTTTDEAQEPSPTTEDDAKPSPSPAEEALPVSTEEPAVPPTVTEETAATVPTGSEEDVSKPPAAPTVVSDGTSPPTVIFPIKEVPTLLAVYDKLNKLQTSAIIAARAKAEADAAKAEVEAAKAAAKAEADAAKAAAKAEAEAAKTAAKAEAEAAKAAAKAEAEAAKAAAKAEAEAKKAAAKAETEAAKASTKDTPTDAIAETKGDAVPEAVTDVATTTAPDSIGVPEGPTATDTSGEIKSQPNEVTSVATPAEEATTTTSSPDVKSTE